MDQNLMKRRLRCCACGGSLKAGLAAVLVDRQATWEAPVWNNVLMEDKTARAVAFVCRKCGAEKRQPVNAVEFNEDLSIIRYYPLAELKEMPPIEGAIMLDPKANKYGGPYF